MAIDTQIRNVTQAHADVLLKSLGTGDIKNDYQRIEKNQQFANPDNTERWNSFVYLLCTLLEASSLSDDQKLSQYFKLLELSRQSPPEVDAGSTARATPGDVLYDSETDKDGFKAWSLTPGWNRLDELIVSDGSGQYFRFSTIFAPYEPKSSSYIVEAEIRVIRSDRNAGFGLIARANDKGGYAVGLGSPDSTANVCYLNMYWRPGDSRSCLEQGPAFDPGRSWHRYDVAVKGNSITLLVDGDMTTTVIDNRFLSSGRVGLWSSAYQLEVRRFKVIEP